MTPSTSYNHTWHVIVAQSLVFCEMKKMLVVAPAGYAALEFDPRNDHHDCHVVRENHLSRFDRFDQLGPSLTDVWYQDSTNYINYTIPSRELPAT